MGKKITIRKAEGNWSVRAGGAVLGESANALELSEGDLAPVIYFPREDIAMAFLDESDHTTHCPHKGDASYFSIVTKSTTIQNAAWSYENPIEDADRIKGLLAFAQSDLVTVERI
ncbi:MULTISPECIES: DUF427 domain-containing protein [Shimia]|uniref:DUF427 domain-containing protein n=1 Tax=Shimia TaxID=573139 RepID=UPI001FB540C6|nr:MULTISPECIES: DUF427 domain-containing protein [Shimia]MDV4143845.1 DUF427 domain-containing protein [Shimia sp. FJ5]